jgi:hypothetical protein
MPMLNSRRMSQRGMLETIVIALTTGRRGMSRVTAWGVELFMRMVQSNQEAFCGA